MDKKTLYYCPYCATRGTLIKFRIPTKKGISRRMVQCPECHNRMKLVSLTRKLSVEEWAQWLYVAIRFSNQIKHEKGKRGADVTEYVTVYQRVNWELLKENLYKYGIASRFWDSWKDIKERFESMDKKPDGRRELENIMEKGYNIPNYEQMRLI